MWPFHTQPLPDAPMTELQNHPSDHGLLQAARDGSQSAIETIVREHQQTALRVAKTLVDPITAEDVAADSMEKLLRSIEHGSGPTEAIRPYLVRIVRNTAADHYRRRRETPTKFDDSSLPSIPDSADQVGDSVLMRAAFESLPERWQSVLWLTCVEDVDRDEVGEHLGIRPGAVSQLALRAREGLRQAYLAQYAHANTPSCEGVAHRLPAYVRKRTKQEETARIEAHLDDCGSCSRIGIDLRGMNQHLGAVLAIALVGGAGAISLVKTPTVAAAATPSWKTNKTVRNAGIGAVVVSGLIATGAVAAGIGASNQPNSSAHTSVSGANSNQTASSASSTIIAPTSAAPTSATSTAPTNSVYPTDPAAPRPDKSVTTSRPTPTPTKTTPMPTPSDTAPTPTPSAPLADSFAVGNPVVAAGSGTYSTHLTIPVTVTRVGTKLTAALWFSGATAHQLLGSSWTCTSSSGGSLGGTAMECKTTTTQVVADLEMRLDATLPEELEATVRSDTSSREVHSVHCTLQV
jgi:RNA polymerase sigma factor (sigma-70 family)